MAGVLPQELSTATKPKAWTSKLMQCFRMLLAGILLILVSGCIYPMGLTKQEWQQLSSEKQAEYRARQYEIDEARRREYEARRAKQQRREVELARKEQEKIRSAYAHARYRDIITITFFSGELLFNKKSSLIEPVALDFVKGETRVIQLIGLNGIQTHISGRLSADGNNFYLGSHPSERLAFVNHGWEAGKHYLINNDAPWLHTRNLKLQIKFKEGSDRRKFH